VNNYVILIINGLLFLLICIKHVFKSKVTQRSNVTQLQYLAKKSGVTRMLLVIFCTINEWKCEELMVYLSFSKYYL
jgi:hypothetical protein